MINDLRIKNIGVIEEVSLELAKGFTVLTGETGAGKTMISTAFQMICGDKVDNGYIRSNEKSANVEAFLLIDPNNKNIERLNELDIEIEDGGVQLSRTLVNEGRGKIILGGRTIPSSALDEITQDLVTIHGQGDQALLNKSSFQRDLLDEYIGKSLHIPLESYQKYFKDFNDLSKQLHELKQKGSENEQRITILNESIKELAEANIEIDEEITINERINLINNSEDIYESLAQADQVLNGIDDGLGGVVNQVIKARKALDSSAQKSDRINTLKNQLLGVEEDLSNLARDINRDLTSLDRDPATIDLLESRRALLKKLLIKYGPTSKDAINKIGEFKKELELVTDIPQAIKNLEAKQTELKNNMSKDAQIIHELRLQHAQDISQQIVKELQALSIPNAQFKVKIENEETENGLDINLSGKKIKYEYDNYGVDKISFEFSANPGQMLKPISKVASGGEMSRIMLAIELVFSKNASPKTMIFDEVDAGIGGSAAIEVGKRLKALAKNHQIVVVTHLPQVAAFADKHFKVEKSASGNVTTSTVIDLDQETRISEIARMMAGLEESSSALEHARELIELSVSNS